MREYVIFRDYDLEGYKTEEDANEAAKEMSADVEDNVYIARIVRKAKPLPVQSELEDYNTKEDF